MNQYESNGGAVKAKGRRRMGQAKSRAGPGPGFTCCQAGDLTNPVSQLYERIDMVFTRNIALAAGRSILIGDTPAERTPSGLWPSDHAGVVTRLEPFATHLPTLISPPPVEGGGNKSTS